MITFTHYIIKIDCLPSWLIKGILLMFIGIHMSNVMWKNIFLSWLIRTGYRKLSMTHWSLYQYTFGRIFTIIWKNMNHGSHICDHLFCAEVYVLCQSINIPRWSITFLTFNGFLIVITLMRRHMILFLRIHTLKLAMAYSYKISL